MKWTRFLDVARQGQCRIENYPPALEQVGLIIGTPSFNIKKITSEMFAKFLPDMEKASKRPGEHEEGDDTCRHHLPPDIPGKTIHERCLVFQGKSSSMETPP